MRRTPGGGRCARDATSKAVGDTRGAVYVEFMVAFMPFFLFFLCLWQVAILYWTKLMVDHAAFSAARAAAVIVAEDPNNVGDSSGTANTLTNTRASLIQNAAYIALAPLMINGTLDNVSLQYPDPTQPPGSADAMMNKQYKPMSGNTVGNIRVRVTATMQCRIAFANLIMCGNFFQKQFGTFGLDPTVSVVGEYPYPYQGAGYTYQ
jgi:Flp pilus assembly protein TadG